MGEDKKIILDEDKWPYWPVLPVKKYNGDFSEKENCGVITSGQPTKVYIGNMFDPEIDLPHAKKYEYTSVEELLEIWTVD